MDPSQKWPCVIYVIGCPGSGKGTLCKKLVEDFNCLHISLGDLLRKISSLPGDENLEVAEYVHQGTLVPTKIVFRAIETAVSPGPANDLQVHLIDGFPRRLDQGMDVELLGLVPNLVLFIDCDKDNAKGRFLTRRLDGRLDDDDALFETRYKEFEQRNPAVVTYYGCLDKLVKINSEGKTEVTYQKLLDALDSRKEWTEMHPSAVGG
ncbi:uncharacterized protein BP5553_07507 [Venustampulla echinocandica]|uniref:P-loop containing nucleoside triphosphate hydrolase n=1 Tax=Venustampulla echinocandica TaxID=2656787 RepID=A0A370TGQ0_9HELO|nr:uncharacterized protein BP5553_07507 [Venustampulla echinocandica]RDL34379.1 hypothetical protein BP5553_07507 [Venustampulla echinocandica]